MASFYEWLTWGVDCRKLKYIPYLLGCHEKHDVIDRFSLRSHPGPPRGSTGVARSRE